MIGRNRGKRERGEQREIKEKEIERGGEKKREIKSRNRKGGVEKKRGKSNQEIQIEGEEKGEIKERNEREKKRRRACH